MQDINNKLSEREKLIYVLNEISNNTKDVEKKNNYKVLMKELATKEKKEKEKAKKK